MNDQTEPGLHLCTYSGDHKLAFLTWGGTISQLRIARSNFFKLP